MQRDEVIGAWLGRAARAAFGSGASACRRRDLVAAGARLLGLAAPVQVAMTQDAQEEAEVLLADLKRLVFDSADQHAAAIAERDEEIARLTATLALNGEPPHP